MNRYSLWIDEEACWGCRTCEVACKQEFHLPSGLRLIAVMEDGPRVAEGRPFFLYRVRICRHCEEPPCMKACPEEAITRRPDGIVALDDKICSGCRRCLESCPYGAIAFDPEGGKAYKCNLCHYRVDRGLVPACADNVCLSHCIHFTARDEDRNCL